MVLVALLFSTGYVRISTAIPQRLLPFIIDVTFPVDIALFILSQSSVHLFHMTSKLCVDVVGVEF